MFHCGMMVTWLKKWWRGGGGVREERTTRTTPKSATRLESPRARETRSRVTVMCAVDQRGYQGCNARTKVHGQYGVGEPRPQLLRSRLTNADVS